jgi:hypothetical protein
MKRTGNWWNLRFVVLGTFLALLALGCNSMKVDRTGTVLSIWPAQHGASRLD